VVGGLSDPPEISCMIRGPADAGLPSVDYPFHDKTVTVTACGRICLKTKKVNLSSVFAGQKVGIKQVDDRLWLTSFMS
jgi:putative transposase